MTSGMLLGENGQKLFAMRAEAPEAIASSSREHATPWNFSDVVLPSSSDLVVAAEVAKPSSPGPERLLYIAWIACGSGGGGAP